MPQGIDPLYFVFVLPAFLLTMYAQYRISSSYRKWSSEANSLRATGLDVAGTVLPQEDMSHVQVETTSGQLSDHYDPTNDILRLSLGVASQSSIAAMSVAAHEIGHAEQDRDGYIWMKLRSGIVPFINIGSSVGYIAFVAGLLLQIPLIAWIGVIFISGGAVFALVTLPVEIDASNRALRILQDYGFIQSEEERKAARNMLNSAALTYIAGAAQAILTIVYYIFALMRSRSSQQR